MKTAIIFGANGQDGFYLNNLLISSGFKVLGVSRSNSKWDIGDIADTVFVNNIIRNEQPQYIFHLAANSTTNHQALFENHDTICTGTLNILESVKLFSPKTKVFLSGSALQFKNDGIAINENTPFDASSAYAVARIQSTYAGRYYRNTFGLKVFNGYFFNHDSPLRTDRHINKKIISAVQSIENGSNSKLELGDLEVRKEFNFAGDLMEAIWILVNQEDVFEAVIGCGQAHSIKDWVKYCFKKIGRNWEEYVTKNNSFIADYDILLSKPDLIKNLGWSPKVNFFQLADMMMASDN